MKKTQKATYKTTTSAKETQTNITCFKITVLEKYFSRPIPVSAKDRKRTFNAGVRKWEPCARWFAANLFTDGEDRGQLEPERTRGYQI